jgi:hypothetical protein
VCLILKPRGDQRVLVCLILKPRGDQRVLVCPIHTQEHVDHLWV